MTRRSIRKSLVVLTAAGFIGGGLGWQPSAQDTAAVPAYQQLTLVDEATPVSNSERRISWRTFGGWARTIRVPGQRQDQRHNYYFRSGVDLDPTFAVAVLGEPGS